MSAIPTEIAIKVPISVNKLTQAVKPNGAEVHVSDKSLLRGGDVLLPKDTPDNARVAIVMDDTMGKREIVEFKASNTGKGIVLVDETLPIIRTILDEKMPIGQKVDQSIINAGDEFNWNEISEQTYGVALNLPKGKNIVGGVTVVFSPQTLSNYKKSLGFR